MKSKNLARLLERIDYLAQNPQEKRLRIDDVQADFLPPLPATVTHLVMNRCHFTLIDNLSSALAYLRMYSCTSSRLVFPQRLEHALLSDCRGFKWLPDLPESLEILGLKGCELKSLPKLNRKLEKLELSNLFQLTGELDLPNSQLQQIDIYDCPLLTGRLCLPDSAVTVAVGKCPGITSVNHRNLTLNLCD